MRPRRAKGWETVMNRTTRARAIGILLLLAACDNLLSVEQRGLITEEQIKQQRLVGPPLAAGGRGYPIPFKRGGPTRAAPPGEMIFSSPLTPWNPPHERILSA